MNAKTQPDPDVQLVFMARTKDGDLWLEPFPEPPPPPVQPKGRRAARAGGGGSYGIHLDGSINTPAPTENGRIWGTVTILVLAIVCTMLGIGGTMIVSGQPVAAPQPVAPDVAAPAPPVNERPAARRLRLLYSSNYRGLFEPGELESIEDDYRADTGRRIDDHAPIE